MIKTKQFILFAGTLLLCSTYVLSSHTSVQVVRAQQEPTVIPTLYCLGSCPTTVPTQSPTAAVQQTIAPNQEPTLADAQPTIGSGQPNDPCNTNQSQSSSLLNTSFHHGGFFQKFFDFFFQLLELLIRLLLGQQPVQPSPPTNPVITPAPGSDPEPTPANTPVPPQDPSVPCPDPTAPNPTVAQNPTMPASEPTGVPGTCEKEVTIDGIQYPNPLATKDCRPVTSPEMWESVRRAELLEDFREHIYGKIPDPTSIDFSVDESQSGNVTVKIVTVSVTGPQGSGSFPFKLFIPNQPKGTFVMLNHRGGSSNDPNQNSGYMPVKTITDAGYAFAVIDSGDTAPDSGGSYASKVLTWFYGSNLPANSSKAVGVWAWSASRAMDYLQTDPAIDATKVAVIGHSRSGKASLWAGAQDTRFAAAISNDSGNTGAKLARRSFTGETVSQINGQFPYWFSDNYKQYNNNEEALPVDQHELIALVAPRRAIVASATEDGTADPEGEFLAYVGATQVYELYGLGNNGLPSQQWQPATNQDFRGDAMSYHLRSGGHGLEMADWNLYLNGNIFDRSGSVK